MAAIPQTVRFARARRLTDSRTLYGTLLKLSESVIFLRITNLERVKCGETFMIGFSGQPEMVCLAKLLDQPPASPDESKGATLRFGLLTELCPIGLL